jgi:hypothetical protein
MLDDMHTATLSRNRIPRLALSAALRWSIGLSVLLTVVLITLLSIRMSAGADPALGPKIVRQSKQSSASQTTQQTQSMLPSVAVPDEEEQAVAPVQQVPAPVTQTPVAPVTQVPVAPVQTTTS